MNDVTRDNWLIEQIEYAERIIATWPEWKKGLLGRLSQPTRGTPRPTLVPDYRHSILCSGDKSRPIGHPGCCCLTIMNRDAMEDVE